MAYTLVVVESPYAPKTKLNTDFVCACGYFDDDDNLISSDHNDEYDYLYDWKTCDGHRAFAVWHVELADNESYARAAMKDCLLRGEAPFASHLLYTQAGVLDDTIPEEREMGIQAGFAWRQVAQKTVVYVDLGISKGMKYGIEDAIKRGCPLEFRTMPKWDTEDDVTSEIIPDYDWRA